MLIAIITGRWNEVSLCVAATSKFQLLELCEFIMARLKTAKLSGEQFKLFQQVVREFDFGVVRSIQRDSTMVYLTYQSDAMEAATKEISRKEICESLIYILSKIVPQETTNREEEKAWKKFCGSDESVRFWRLIESIFTQVQKWAKAIKGKSVARNAIYRLLAVILGFARNATRDTFADSILRSIIGTFKGHELFLILRDFLSYLKFSDVTPFSLSESLATLLDVIVDQLILPVGEVVTSETSDLLVDLGIDIGHLALPQAAKLVCSYLEHDDLSVKYIGASILRDVAMEIGRAHV